MRNGEITSISQWTGQPCLYPYTLVQAKCIGLVWRLHKVCLLSCQDIIVQKIVVRRKVLISIFCNCCCWDVCLMTHTRSILDAWKARDPWHLYSVFIYSFNMERGSKATLNRTMFKFESTEFKWQVNQTIAVSCAGFLTSFPLHWTSFLGKIVVMIPLRPLLCDSKVCVPVLLYTFKL